MNSLKMVYVDIYHTKFEDDGIMPKELIHLHAMDVYTNISVAEIIEQLRLCIYHRYGDGLFIKAEEFQTECFLTVEIFFGDDYSSLTDYLSSINLPHKIPKQISKLTNNDVALSVDFMANQEEIKELEVLLKRLGYTSEVYFIERVAFSRGADDYHENVILAFITGAVEALGSRVMHKLIDKFEEHQEVRIHRIDIDHILTYISEETGINKQDLRVGKRVSISNTQTEIIILNRYKNIRVIYDEKNCKLIEYEVRDKTQTMI